MPRAPIFSPIPFNENATMVDGPDSSSPLRPLRMLPAFSPIGNRRLSSTTGDGTRDNPIILDGDTVCTDVSVDDVMVEDLTVRVNGVQLDENEERIDEECNDEEPEEEPVSTDEDNELDDVDYIQEFHDAATDLLDQIAHHLDGYEYYSRDDERRWRQLRSMTRIKVRVQELQEMCMNEQIRMTRPYFLDFEANAEGEI